MKRLLALTLAAAVCCSVDAAEKKKKRALKIPERVLKLYEPSEYKGMPYRLMKPANFDPAKTYPLILSRHGAGGKGTDPLMAGCSDTIDHRAAEMIKLMVGRKK